MAQTTVTGMNDGKAETVVAAHSIHGGVANKGPQYHAEKISNTNIDHCQGVTTVGDVKGETVNITGGSTPATGQQNKPKDIRDYTVDNVADLLKKEKFPDSIITKFVENGIDGKYFIDMHDDDEVLKELNVTSALHKMKIRTLIKSFSQQ